MPNHAIWVLVGSYLYDVDNSSLLADQTLRCDLLEIEVTY